MSIVDERESWLTYRVRGLGGTDVAAILGHSPWNSALSVYLGKTGQSGPPRPATEAMEWGNDLEALIAAKFARVTGTEVLRGGEIATLFPGRCTAWENHCLVMHPFYNYLLGTPDGVAPKHNRGLEIKNVGWRNPSSVDELYKWGEQGSADVPLNYFIQCMWYMTVLGPAQFPRWDVAVLFSGNRMEVFTIHFDQAQSDGLVEAARQFWNDHVLKGVPPPIDASESYAKYLGKRFAIERRPVIPATPEIKKWAWHLDAARHKAEVAAANEQLAKNHLMALIGDAKGAQGDFGKVTWIRPRPSMIVDWEGVARGLFAWVQADEETRVNLGPLPATIDPLAQLLSTERAATPYLRVTIKEESEHGNRSRQLVEHL